MSPRTLALLLCITFALGAAPPQKDKEKPKEEEYAPFKNYVSTDRMIEQYQGEIKRDPKAYNSYTLLGSMYLRRARETGDYTDYDRADEAFERSLKLVRGYGPALSGRAFVLSARHRFAEALRLVEELIRKNPEEPGLRVQAADVRLDMGDYKTAEKIYREVQRKNLGLGLHTRHARLAEIKGDTTEALKRMQKAIEEEAPSALTPQGRSWYPFRMGEMCFNAGQIDKAANHLETALELHPNYPLSLAYLGKVRVAQGKRDEAIKLYVKALSVNGDLSMLADLGDLYAKTGKDFLSRLSYEKLENSAKGQAAFARELSLFNSNHDRNLPEALELARQDLRVRQDVYAHDTLAWALCKNKRYKEAAEAMAEALEPGTKDAVLFYHAGMIYAGLGEKDKARDYLKKALDLNPHFSLFQAEKARKALADLK
jgi:tetratricopeptide (TPR) repeat protein